MKVTFGGVTLEATAVDATTVTVDQDPGDEDDGSDPPWRTFRSRYGGTIVLYSRSWFEEKPRCALPDHDGGDEDPWQPLSELSRRRLARSLL